MAQSRTSTSQSPTPRPSSPLSPRPSDLFQRAIHDKYYSKAVKDKDGFLLELFQQKDAGAAGKCAALRFFISHHTNLFSPEIIKLLMAELSTFYSKHASKLSEDPGLPSLTAQVEEWSGDVIQPLLLKHQEVLRRCVSHIPKENSLRADVQRLLEQVNASLQKNRSLTITAKISNFNKLNNDILLFYKKNAQLINALPRAPMQQGNIKDIPTKTLTDELVDSIDQVNKLEQLHIAIVTPRKSRDSKTGTPSPTPRVKGSFSDSRSPQGSFVEDPTKAADSDQKRGPAGRASTSATRSATGSVEKEPLGDGQRTSMSKTEAFPSPDQDMGFSPNRDHPFLNDVNHLNKSFRIPGSTSESDEAWRREKERRSIDATLEDSQKYAAMDDEPLQPPLLKRLGRGLLFFLFNPARLSEEPGKKWGWRAANLLVWIGIGFAFPPLLALGGLKLPALLAGVAMNTAIATQASTALWGVIYALFIQGMQLIPGFCRRCTVKPVEFPITPAAGRRLTDEEDRVGFRPTEGLGKMGSLSRSGLDPDTDQVSAYKRGDGSQRGSVESLPEPSNRHSNSESPPPSNRRSTSEGPPPSLRLPTGHSADPSSPLHVKRPAATPSPAPKPLPTDQLIAGGSAQPSFGYGAVSDR